MVTRVYVQNHTTDSFLADRRSVRFPPGHALPQRAYEWLTRSIDPSKRQPLLEFDRGSNVADGEDYEFRTELRAGGASIELRQRMRGTPLHSKLWSSAGDHPWFDDERFHTVIWPTPRGLVEIVYRSYNTAGDNDIEYVLNRTWPPNPTQDTFHVLAYNVRMRSRHLFANGQVERAHLIPQRVRDFDVLILSEVFDGFVRRLLLEDLGADYPYHTLNVGSDGPFPWNQDGGAMILSKWPIQARDRLAFKDQLFRPFPPNTLCESWDCNAEKGVVYARIAKEERTFHVFGTHMQAGSDDLHAHIRNRQLLIIQSFMDSKGIPPSDMVIVGGDLNIDKGTNEYNSMLAILRATDPPASGHPWTVDPEINDTSNSDGQKFLDYTLYSRRHLQPLRASAEVRLLRSPSGWGWGEDDWELSDHFPIHGRFDFGRPAAAIAPPALDLGRVRGNTSATGTLTVRSVGSGPVTIRDVQLGGGGAASFQLTVTLTPPGPLPVVLAPGQSFPVTVSFRAAAEGGYEARVVVTSEDVVGAPVTFFAVVSAQVVVPDMAVLPTSINFGPVPVGQQRVRNVLVTNPGSAPLRFRVQPPTQGPFQWTGDTAGVGRTLQPGDQAVVAVRFVPATVGAHSASVVVVGDDEPIPVRVSLAGQGVAP
jgi:endonuclease/exonuclease/phosphatase family metal-dependent hydrolase